MNFLIWSFVESFFSGSNLHRNFSGFLGKGWVGHGTATTSWERQGWLVDGLLGWLAFTPSMFLRIPGLSHEGSSLEDSPSKGLLGVPGGESRGLDDFPPPGDK